MYFLRASDIGLVGPELALSIKQRKTMGKPDTLVVLSAGVVMGFAAANWLTVGCS